MAAVDEHQFFKYNIKHAIYAGLLFHINIDPPKKKQKKMKEQSQKLSFFCYSKLIDV